MESCIFLVEGYVRRLKSRPECFAFRNTNFRCHYLVDSELPSGMSLVGHDDISERDETVSGTKRICISCNVRY